MVVRELLARFGIDFDDKQLEAGSAGLEGMIGKLRTLGKVIVGSAVVVGISRFVDEVSRMGAELDHVSKMLGLSAEELREWQAAAELSGASGQDVTSAIQGLQGQMKSVLTGGEEAIRMFARLGVSTSGIWQRSAADVFEEVAGKLGNVSNETERAMIANALLGGSAANLHGLFRQGADGIARLRGEVRGLASADMTAFGEASSELRSSLTRFGLAIESLKMRLGLALFPALSAMISAVARGIAWFRDFTAGTHALEAAFLVLIPVIAIFARSMVQAGIRIALAWAPLILKAALIAAAIAAVVLIVDDLIALFTGGESVIGDFIDQLFGVGSAAAFVEGTKELVADLVEWLGKAWETSKEWGAIFLEVLGDIAAFLGETFGPAFEAAKGFFSSLLDLGLEVAKLLRTALSSVWGYVVDSIREKLGAMGELVQKVADFFGIDWQDVKEGAKDAARLAAAGLEATYSVGTKAVQATTQAVRQVNQRTEVGQIVVQGAGDPEAVAQAVQDKLRAQQEADLEAAYGDLVPVGG